MVECLAAAGRKEGLPADVALKLARRTVIGAGALLKADPASAEELRRNVTSPHGTTGRSPNIDGQRRHGAVDPARGVRRAPPRPRTGVLNRRAPARILAV
jgi:hypothetical protein